MPTASRLSHFPALRYLIREYDHAYRHGSAGGSALIRSHLRQVRDSIGRHLEADPPVRLNQPEQKPVCAHFDRTIANGEGERMASLVRAIRPLTTMLSWRYGYEKMPRALDKKYAYAEFLGPEGPVVGETLVLGLVLFAPKCVYPTHSHRGIAESYICLSGACSENDTGVYAPGSLIFNPPGHSHRITIGDREPCLLAYAWIGDADALSRPMMKFSRSRNRTERV